MRKFKMHTLLFIMLMPSIMSAQTIAVLWSGGKPKGVIEVKNGKLESIKLEKGTGRTEKGKIEITADEEVRIELKLSEANINLGSYATIVTINTSANPFSFFLRDVNKSNPIYIPGYKVIVTESNDKRSFSEIERSITNKNLETNLQRIEEKKEESFENAAAENRKQIAPTWLGISRDMRIFELTGIIGNDWRESECITPRNSSSGMKLPEFGNSDVVYAYTISRGVAVANKGSRRLEQGILPILHTTLYDDDIVYNTTSFVVPEKTILKSRAAIGTHYLVADHYSVGAMFTESQKNELKTLLKVDSTNAEETVLYCRAEALNEGSVPRYAYFKTIRPGYGWWNKSIVYNLDKETGMSVFSSGRVFAISKLNGQPMKDEEMGILLQPGQKAVMEFCLPHSPVSKERAQKISENSFDARLAENISFWNSKLDNAASINIPENRINEMLKAGLLHLDLVTYGKEPAGTLAPCIGVYSPIGTESSPIIQFYCSMGWKDVARRSLQYFIDKQHDDGMIQNFGGYMVETGAALYTIGEYYRYFHDDEWIKQIKPKLIKSCDYLIAWRNKNKIEKLRGNGYGMIDGKVADPEDQYHQYMLNAYAYIGISRTAEILSAIDPAVSKKLKVEAEQWKKDIRESLMNSVAHSPVVPIGNGTWVPTVPPWTEAVAPQVLFADSAHCFSHGSFTVRDALIGPLYLVFCEVLDVNDPVSKMMLDYHSELLMTKNVAFSQPYYTRNDWIQLKRGMVKPFLATYYNTVSAMADRETYTFYEHVHHVSVHKTHEEAWFLMQTRWMLYLEEGSVLRLLPGIPRAWLEDGKKIEVKNAVSYFGNISFSIVSDEGKGYITAEIECNSDRKPSEIVVRIPHPDGRKAKKVSEGVYNPADETLTIKNFTGKAVIRAEY